MSFLEFDDVKFRGMHSFRERGNKENEEYGYSKEKERNRQRMMIGSGNENF